MEHQMEFKGLEKYVTVTQMKRRTILAFGLGLLFGVMALLTLANIFNF